MDVTFLFLDESVDLNTAWLTGVFIPSDRYPDVRDAVLRIARDTLLAAGHEHPRPTDLHGVDLLRGVAGVTDEHRVKVFEKVAELVNREELEIISIGHKQADAIRRNMQLLERDPGDKLYNHNFDEMVEALLLADDDLVIPVFDGVPRQRTSRGAQPVDGFAYETFIEGGLVTHWRRVVAELRPLPFVRYKTNLRNLAEPTFSDAAQSPLLQLADLIGYLLGVEARAGLAPCSEWKTRLAGVAKTIDRALVHRRSFTMNFQHAP